jgi:hypothetical protein
VERGARSAKPFCKFNRFFRSVAREGGLVLDYVGEAGKIGQCLTLKAAAEDGLDFDDFVRVAGGDEEGHQAGGE